VSPSWVWVSAPATGGRIVASVVMVSEAMTVRALNVRVKTQTVFRSIGGGKSR